MRPAGAFLFLFNGFAWRGRMHLIVRPTKKEIQDMATTSITRLPVRPRLFQRPSPHPHLQIRHRGPDVALGTFRDLAGDGDGSAPSPGEECRESLVFRWLEADRLKAGLEPFR